MGLPDAPVDKDPGLRQLIQRAVDEAARLLSADGAFIDRIHPETGRLRTEYIYGQLTGDAAELVRGIELVPGEGLYGRAVEQRTILCTDDYLHDDSFPHTPAADDFARRAGITSVIAAPWWREPTCSGSWASTPGVKPPSGSARPAWPKHWPITLLPPSPSPTSSRSWPPRVMSWSGASSPNARCATSPRASRRYATHRMCCIASPMRRADRWVRTGST